MTTDQPAFKLGDTVEFTDYLQRVEMSWLAVLSLNKVWGGMPQKVVTEAEKRVQNRDDKKPRRAGWLEGDPYGLDSVRTWIPARMAQSPRIEIGTTERVAMLYRRHPAPYFQGFTLPMRGVVVQKVALQHGEVTHDYEYGSTFHLLESTAAYRIAYHLSRLPVTVSVDVMTPVTP